MNVQGLHHVAYRCKDARETTEFYTKYLDLEFDVAIAENEVPSTGEWSPHIHLFFRMDDGSCVAFFELPEAPDMKLDPNTPDWVQHLALKVPDMETQQLYKDRLEADGIEVIGPIDHQLCQSIYFFDPNGHRLELAVDTMTDELAAKLGALAEPVLAGWSETKTAPDVDWLHENDRS